MKLSSRETVARPQLHRNRQSLPKRLNRHDRLIRYQFTWHLVMRKVVCEQHTQETQPSHFDSRQPPDD
jgi:hypothetical protein